MWPDHEDIVRVLKTLPSPKPSAESIYSDTALTHCLLFEAYGHCRNHGRHKFLPVDHVKKFVETFIGRAIDGTALMVAIRMNGFQTKSDKSVLQIKLPPLERFEEVRDLWNQRQVVEQKQVDEEVKRWAAYQLKHSKPLRVV